MICTFISFKENVTSNWEQNKSNITVTFIAIFSLKQGNSFRDSQNMSVHQKINVR